MSEYKRLKTLGLREFAKLHRLKTSLDDCGDPVIRGKRGQIYEWGPGRLAAMFSPARPSARQWASARRAMQGSGFRLVKNGDLEGTQLFEDGTAEQVRLAVRILGIKRRRKLSPEQAAKAAENLARFRLTPA
jgi:hypothetical protein